MILCDKCGGFISDCDCEKFEAVEVKSIEDIEKVNIIPKTIFLQIKNDNFENWMYYTWAEERVDETDIEYILKSKYEELKDENDLLNDYIRDQESDIDERNDLIRELEKQEILLKDVAKRFLNYLERVEKNDTIVETMLIIKDALKDQE